MSLFVHKAHLEVGLEVLVIVARGAAPPTQIPVGELVVEVEVVSA